MWLFGTDGQGSGNNLNMFESMSFAGLLQKGVNENSKLMPSYEIIKMATINGAKALNVENETGSIEENKKADLIILNLETEMTEPVNDIFSNIVYNVTPINVETTIINGRIAMEDRKIPDLQEKEIYKKCKSVIKRLT